MITAFRFRVSVAASVVTLVALVAGACQKVPLLAPTGSTITLTASATALPLGGSTTLIVQIVEAAGTPPHQGTHVIFTTTLGTVLPSEGQTDINGRVTARFNAGGASGTATITATSGNASGGGSSSGTTTVAASNVVKIALGAAAVGSVNVSANPAVLQPTNTGSTITAVVGDTNGNPLSGVPVTFSTDAGTVSPSFVTTDANGIAITTLRTTKTAKVTAKAGIPTGSGTTATTAVTADVTVTVVSQPTVAISSSTANPTVNTPVNFTIAATPSTGNAITSIVVDYDDGRRSFLTGNATSVSHVYTRAGTFVVTATATESTGAEGAGSTVIVVGDNAVASFTVTPPSPTRGVSALFDGSGSTSASPITSYSWNFGDGTPNASGVTTTHSYAVGLSPGLYIVTLTITDSASRSAVTSKQINVQ